MLRITQVDTKADTGRAACMRVEGTLSGESIPALWDACRTLPMPSSSNSTEVVLDISGVRFVDAAGTVALHELMSRGVRVTGCSPLVRGLLEMEACDERSA